MKKGLWFALLLSCLFAGAAAAQSSQVDEPPPATPPSNGDEAEDEGVSMAFYMSAGKALRAYDFTRLNHTLGSGGGGAFGEYIDDWHFEMVFAGTQTAFFALAGGFWEQEAGGAAFDSMLEGWELLARWGVALAANDTVQLYPNFGIGYAQQTLTLDGNLRGLDIGDLPARGEVEIEQNGMLLEAALRVDIYSIVPEKASVGFLMDQSLTLGWLGVPWHSHWQNGSHTIHVPQDLTNAFFLRYSVGFGFGVR